LEQGLNQILEQELEQKSEKDLKQEPKQELEQKLENDLEQELNQNSKQIPEQELEQAIEQQSEKSKESSLIAQDDSESIKKIISSSTIQDATDINVNSHSDSSFFISNSNPNYIFTEDEDGENTVIYNHNANHNINTNSINNEKGISLKSSVIIMSDLLNDNNSLDAITNNEKNNIVNMEIVEKEQNIDQPLQNNSSTTIITENIDSSLSRSTPYSEQIQANNNLYEGENFEKQANNYEGNFDDESESYCDIQMIDINRSPIKYTISSMSNRTSPYKTPTSRTPTSGKTSNDETPNNSNSNNNGTPISRISNNNNNNDFLKVIQRRLFVENSPFNLKNMHHLSQIRNKSIEEEEKENANHNMKEKEIITSINKTQETEMDIDMISVGDSSASSTPAGESPEFIIKNRNEEKEEHNQVNSMALDEEEINQELTFTLPTEDILKI